MLGPGNRHDVAFALPGHVARWQHGRVKKAFITCHHCYKPFLLPVQVPQGAAIQDGQTCVCSHCKAVCAVTIDAIAWHEIGLDGSTRED